MASHEIAAMLDELMGRNRNANPNEKVKEISWEDSSVCKYYLVNFCPHDLFTNTKADLGACPKIHDDDLRSKFQEAKESSRKTAAEDEFLRFCQRMLTDLGHKIKRSKERLLLTQMEQAAANGVPPEKQEEIEEKINVLTDKINVLVDQAEQAGCKGDVEEAQGLLKLCDQFKAERDELKGQIGIKSSGVSNGPDGGSGGPPSLGDQKPIFGYHKGTLHALGADGQFGPQKAMEVCEICGAFLIVGDSQTRIDMNSAAKIKKWQDDHLMGKQHVGYARLRGGVDTLLEDRRKKREEREKEKEAEAEERRKRREEERKSEAKDDVKDEKRRSKSKDRKRSSRDRDRRRSRSRGGGGDRRRSRSRGDRKRRSRSRDRKSERKRSRSRGGGGGESRRSRSRDRSRRDRSRDRSRDRKSSRRDSKDRD